MTLVSMVTGLAMNMNDGVANPKMICGVWDSVEGRRH